MTLWTPGGEHRVPPKPPEAPPQKPGEQPASPPPSAGESAESAAAAEAAAQERLAAAGIDLDSLSPEERQQAEAMMAELAAAQERLAAAPPEAVVANHAMGLYELGAIHLTADPPRLDASRLAIDAMGALVDGLRGRFGESETTLREALGSLRMAYVQRTKATASET